MRIFSAVINAVERFFQGIGPFEDVFFAECATALTSEKLSVRIRRFLDGSVLQGQTFLVVRIESPAGDAGLQRADIHLTAQHAQKFDRSLNALLQEILPEEEGGEEEQLIPRLFRNSLVARKLSQSAIERRRSIDYAFGPRYFEADLLKNYKYKEQMVCPKGIQRVGILRSCDVAEVERSAASHLPGGCRGQEHRATRRRVISVRRPSVFVGDGLSCRYVISRRRALAILQREIPSTRPDNAPFRTPAP